MKAFHKVLIFVVALAMAQVAFGAAKKGVVRVSGDNEWQVFIDGELAVQNANWQQPTVTEFELKNGRAVIAVYVHDAEPGGAGVGGFLADIILDDGTYIFTGEGQDWVCDAGDPIAKRNDGWEKPDFDDSGWKELTIYDQFGGGVWGFGAAQMAQILKDPDSEAFWSWCDENNVTDDVYFRYRFGALDVEPTGKVAMTWASLKTAR